MAEKRAGSFVKQAAILAGAGILVRILGFMYRIPLINMIGDLGNGIYSAGFYIYTFLLILSSAGLPAAISKMVSERRARGEYQNAHTVFRVSLLAATVLGFVAMVLMMLFAQQIADISNSPESYTCILTLSPTLLIVAVMSAYRGYFQGMNAMVPTAVSQVVEQIFNAVFSVYLAYLFMNIGVPKGDKNIVLAAAGGTAGTGIGALAGLGVIFFAYWLLRPILKRQLNREAEYGTERESRRDIAKILFATAGPIIAGTAVFSITNLIDMTMVTRILEGSGYTHDQAQVLYGQLSGKYVTLTTLPVSISTAVAMAAIPSIAASMALRKKQIVHRKMNLTLRVSMLISVPAAVGIGVLGKEIIQMLFPLHPEGGSLLTVGAIAIIFLALCQTVTGILQGIGRVHVPVVGAVLGALAKVGLNYILIPIPSLNVLGAVLSTTGCYLVASVYNMWRLSVLTRVKFDLVGALGKPILGSLVMGAACLGVYHGIYFLWPNNTFCTLISIVIGVGVYSLVMLFMRGITEEDVRMMPMGERLAGILHRVHLL